MVARTRALACFPLSLRKDGDNDGDDDDDDDDDDDNVEEEEEDDDDDDDVDGVVVEGDCGTEMSVVDFMVLLMIRVWTGVAILRTLSLPTILVPNRNISTSVKC